MLTTGQLGALPKAQEFSERPGRHQVSVAPEQRAAELEAQRVAFAAMSESDRAKLVAQFERLRVAAIAHRTLMAQVKARLAIQRAQHSW